MSWNVLLEGRLRNSAGTAIDVLIATQALTTLPSDTPDNAILPGIIRSSITLKQSVNLASNGGGRDSSLAIGRVEIDNTEGDISAWSNYSIEMEPWALYVIPLGKPFAERVLIARFRGRKKPEVVRAGVLALNFGDRMTRLETRLGSDYGTGISNTQLRERPRPVVLGYAYQVPCTQPEVTGNDRFDVHDNEAFGGVTEVRDNGVLREFGTQWRADSESTIHGYELLTARGGKQAATVDGALKITGTDALAGIGDFSALADLDDWLVGTSTSDLAQPWSATDKAAAITLSNSDFDATNTDTSGTGRSVRGAHLISIAKAYWEVHAVGSPGARILVGVARSYVLIDSLNLSETSESFGWDPATGRWYASGIEVAVTPVVTGTVYRFAYDATGKIWVGDVTGWLNGDPAAGTGGFDVQTNMLLPAVTLFSATQGARMRAATAVFSYSVPSGFAALQSTAVAGVVALSGGGLRIASNGESVAQLYGSGLTADAHYILRVDVLSRVSGAVQILCNDVLILTVSTVGTYARAFVAGSSSLQIRRAPGLATDLVLDNLKIEPVESTQFLPGLINFCAERAGLVEDDLHLDSIAALHTAAPYRIGIAAEGDDKIRDVLTLALDAWLGWVIFDWADQLRVGRLTKPIEGESVATFDERVLYGPIYGRPDEAKGVSRTLLYQKNWEPFDDAEIPPAIVGIERDLIKAEYRGKTRVTASSTYLGFDDSRNPTDRDRVPVPGMPTVLIDGADAQTEADRRANEVFATPNFFHEFSVLLDPSDLSPCFLHVGEQVGISNAHQSGYLTQIDVILLEHAMQFPEGIVTMLGHGAPPED